MRPTAGVDHLATELRLAVTRMARRLRQEASEGLGPSQVATLSSVERHGPLTPSRLAELERVQRPTVTRLVARLEDAGLIERAIDPSDGRSCRVSVTAAGSELLAAMRERKDAYIARGLDALDAGDRATLERASLILVGMLEREPR